MLELELERRQGVRRDWLRARRPACALVQLADGLGLQGQVRQRELCRGVRLWQPRERLAPLIERDQPVAGRVKQTDERVHVLLVTVHHFQPLEASGELRAAHEPITTPIEGVIQVGDAKGATAHLLGETPLPGRRHEKRVLVFCAEHGLQVCASPLKHPLWPAAARAHLREPSTAVFARVRLKHAQQQSNLWLWVRHLAVDEAKRRECRLHLQL